MNTRQTWIVLAGIIAVGAFLRFYNLNWDQGFYFHPDERNIATAVSKIHFFDNLNPEFFAYGGFSIYLYRFFGEIIILLTNDPQWVSSWGKINLIGRYFSAFVSTITLIPLYFLAKKIFNKEVAQISVVIFAFTVTSIQAAHFAVTESLLVFFVTLLALLSQQILQKSNFNIYLLTGAILGLSTATKTTSLSFATLPLFAWFSTVTFDFKNIFSKFIFLVIFLFAAFFTFTIFSPYTFLSWDKFLESMQYETGVIKGTLPVPYTMQFTNTTPFVYQIKNFFWQMGPIATFSWLGILILTFKTLKEKSTSYLFFLSFPFLYFLYIGSLYTKFIRYMVPLVPFLAITCAFSLYYIKTKSKFVGQFLIIIFVTLTILWALSFSSIYNKEQTRISASRWIYANIPAGSYIIGEHWDDGLPLPLKGQNLGQYKIEQLTIYEPDNPAKLDYYIQKLSEADYIILNSRRLYGTLINLPAKYPLSSRYYQLLFAGELGFEKVAQFSSYPQILGWEINDDSSEETFQIFDHPKVQIFKKVKPFTKAEYLKIL